MMMPSLKGSDGLAASAAPASPIKEPVGEELPVEGAVEQDPGFALRFDQTLFEQVHAASPRTDETLPTPEQASAAMPTGEGEAGAVDAEQWLAMMFGQLTCNLQAREAGLAAQQPQQAMSPAMPVSLPVPRDVRMGDSQAIAEAGVQAPVSEKTAGASSPVEELPGVAQVEADSLAAPGRQAVSWLAEAMRPAPSEGNAVAAATASSAAAPAAAAERLLNLRESPQARWGEQMLGALRDSVELQLRQGLQQATIRLDPAELGRLDIQLSQEGGRLQVQISAGQADVVRLLQQTSERLRQDLIGQAFTEVSVQVGSDSQQGRQQERRGARPDHADAIAQAAVPADAQSQQQRSSGDILITV